MSEKSEKPANGPRGPSTVAPGTAHLVVVAQVGPVRKVVETIVYRPRVEDFVVNDVGLVAASSMEVQSDIDVYGLTSLSDPQRVPAALHANGRDLTATATSLRWISGPVNTAEITGAVSTSQEVIDFGAGSVFVDETHLSLEMRWFLRIISLEWPYSPANIVGSKRFQQT